MIDHFADQLLFSSITAQTLAETRRSVHGSPFPTHDPDTTGPGFPVPPDPAGKVSTSLFLIVFLKRSEHQFNVLHESVAVKRHFSES